MRLKHIKLAGFKSFVDPTKVPFEQQMTAIVGPNGCGKSNIIDAVRWVLGESSAKNLRGDAMTDVIFNGAASRKPIGQASVELVFDNLDGRIQGNMADRNQISVRRLVNRESTNTYFLNGTKCRRRDITDIFLGTGLGPRSYAIIEQGTISRLIESKPHELRVFIEEAAGISKYKERRKDTENRIRHTRENLSRLNDIRAELSLQIDKLHKQSEAAKRFRTLKAQERKYKAEFSVLRWQAFEKQSAQQQELYNKANANIEVITALQNEQNITLFQAKQQVEEGNKTIAELNNRKLTLTNDIARTEQNIKHLKQQSSSITQNNDITQQQLLNAQALLKTEQEKRTTLENSLTTTLPQLTKIEADLLAQQQHLDTLTVQQRENQQVWSTSYQQINTYKETLAAIEHKKQLEQQKYEHAISEIASLQKQLTLNEQQYNEQKLDTTQVDVNRSDAVNNALTESYKQQKSVNEMVLLTQQQINETKQLIASEKASQLAFEHNIESLNEQLSHKEDWQLNQHQCLSELAATSTEPPVENIQTVMDMMQVEAGWEKAVESLLLHWLQAEVVSSIADSLPLVKHLDAILLVEHQASQESLENKGLIVDKIKHVPSAFTFLHAIYFANTLAEAQQMLPTLARDESVICPDSTWLGANFVRKGAFEQSTHHLQLQEKHTQLCNKTKQLTISIEKNEVSIVHLEEMLSQQLLTQKAQQDEIKNTEQLLQEAKQAEALAEQNEQFYVLQQQKIQHDIAQHEKNSQAFQQVVIQLNDEHSHLVAPDHEHFEALTIQQEEMTKAIQVAQKQMKTLADDRHHVAIKVEQFKNEKDQCQQNVQSVQQTIERLSEQQTSNQCVIDNSVEPLKIDEEKLVQWLKEMSEIDKDIEKRQDNIAQAQEKVSTLEFEQKKNQDKILDLREKSAKFHLDHESFRLRAESSLDLLRDTQQSFDAIQSNMPKNAKESIWQAHIVRLSKDIDRLGAINLAAIEEYENQLTRKAYLDTQHNDLTLAISTLETAIEKIDKESRQKFKHTFDQVNKDLKSLFPKVFGGGRAYLELTGTDMLDTGVSIMAQPPGKKNSTIHLLSGGEKALTALSLVFAIFRLNPAPFCMLDEVDAPLDDANVSRFCNLVREMSRTVQFIYISHNKIAMEMASHLTGVTMFEPGVSKMVAVDIEEAVAMAEIS